MNKEKLIKLQNFIKENNIEDDELVEQIMCIDADESKKIKAYWESMNNRFFKKTHDTFAEFVHISSVKVSSEYNVRAYIDRYAFNIYNGIFLNCENNYEISCSLDEHSTFNDYKEITEDEYNKTICKLKDLVKQSENIFKQIK